MVSYKALNTECESIISYACNGTGNDHRGKAAATVENIPYTRNGIVFPLIRYLIGDIGG